MIKGVVRELSGDPAEGGGFYGVLRRLLFPVKSAESGREEIPKM